MFPLLRKRSKKSKDRMSPPTDPLPPMPNPRPLTTSGFSIPARPLVHRHVRGLPISPPFSRVEFRHRTSPSSPMHHYHSPPSGVANLSDATTLANSPNSVTSPLSSGSERDIPDLESPVSSPVELNSHSDIDKVSIHPYYDADDGSGPGFGGRDNKNRVSYHRWAAPSPSVSSPSPSERHSGASTRSSVDRGHDDKQDSPSSGCSKQSQVYLDEDQRAPSFPAHPYDPHPRADDPLRRFGILRWETQLTGTRGQRNLWVYIYKRDEHNTNHMVNIDRIPITFPPEMTEPVRNAYDLVHISRSLARDVDHKRERDSDYFPNQDEELELYRKELQYLAAIPSPSSRGRILPIGIVPPSLIRKPVPCPDIPQIYQWKVTQRNVIDVPCNVAHKKWYTGSILGEGTFGRVYLVYNVPHRVELAMKVVYIKRPMSKIVCEGLVNELKVFDRLTKADAQNVQFIMTPNISTGLWAWQSIEGFLHINSHFCPGGDLYEYLGRLSHDQLRLVISELVLGLECLHKLGIVHHDLKPENVLVDADGHCVITDYGGSKFLEEGFLIRKSKHEVICTLPYAAPELLSESTLKYRHYDEAVDYWALGATIFTLATGDELFSGDAAQVKQKHMSIPNTLYDRMRGLPSDLLSLTAALLVLDPGRRLRGPVVRQHPYFAIFRHLWPDVTHKRLGSPIPFVRNVGGHARGFNRKCKSWPSEHVPETAGSHKTVYFPNILAKEGLELSFDDNFDVPLEHSWLTN